jgi:hypothetical protein
MVNTRHTVQRRSGSYQNKEVRSLQTHLSFSSSFSFSHSPSFFVLLLCLSSSLAAEMICYKQSWFPVQLYMINPICKKKDVSALIVECNNHFWIRSSKLRQLTNSEFESVSFVVKELPKDKKVAASVMELKTMIGFELGKLLQEQVLLAPTVLQSIIVFMYAIACGKNRWPEVLSNAEQLPVKKNTFSSWKMNDKFFHKRLKPFDCILDFTQTIIRGMNLFLLISCSTPKHILHEVHEIKFKYDTTKPASESTEVWSAVLATVKESV